ncbi:MAG TPA: hypothetical protein VJT67_15295 [Longimicrobiaceae bacterium]|nr:hypothetical protein [Longimicrobiaceae bacterium]
MRKVSLAEAIKLYSTGSLVSAKKAVDNLLAGSEVVLTFSDQEKLAKFQTLAESLGVYTSEEEE